MFPALDESRAAAFAEVALANIERAFPHQFDHPLVDEPAAPAPDHVALHPVFFGSFDWHSSVHMHWLLELRAELERLAATDRAARAWADAVDPLADDLAARLAAFVTAAPYPVRSGVHSCTAFALGDTP